MEAFENGLGNCTNASIMKHRAHGCFNYQN